MNPTAIQTTAIAPYRVAAIQFSPTLFKHQENLQRLEALTIEAAKQGARLIVHPEMATTGYCWGSREEVSPFVEPVPGPTTDRFTEIAEKYDCWIVTSMPEISPATGVYYNSAVLIGPEGVEGLYRKTHSYIAEPTWAKDGDLGLPVFDTPLGRIGLLICMDVTYPETARIEALLGADLICLPTNWVGDGAPAGSWISRAVENGIYIVATDRDDVERGAPFCGHACVIDPDGAVQSVLAAGDGIAFGEIDIAKARNKRFTRGAGGDILADRRPDLYHSITRNTYLWNPESFHGNYGLRPLPVGKESRIAVAQFAPVPGDIDENLESIARLAAECGDAELIVFPAMAVTGEVFDCQHASRLAETIPGPNVAVLQEIAREQDAHLVVGLIERGESGALFESVVVVGPDGLAGVARKSHLTSQDREWATPGNLGLVTIDLPLGRVGVLVGYDAFFPEAVRSLAIDGADIIVCPSLSDWPPVIEAGGRSDRFVLWRERARENKIYLAVANGAAPYGGWSGIYGPDPEDYPDEEIIISGTGDGAVSWKIDTRSPDSRYPTNPIRMKTALGRRQPIWYDLLQATDLDAAKPDWASQHWTE
jgi:predicted amidohydrolase